MTGLAFEDATLLHTGFGATQDEAAGAVNSQWISTYAPVVSSGTALALLQTRLDRLPGDKNAYFHAKAQCWINAAQQARQANDHWGFVEEAIGQAAMITMSLENGAPLSAANPALRTVSTVRPDLWKIVNTIKSDPAVAQCPQAQPPLACAEVELMQAGHDAWRRSFLQCRETLARNAGQLASVGGNSAAMQAGSTNADVRSGAGTCSCFRLSCELAAKDHVKNRFSFPFQRR